MSEHQSRKQLVTRLREAAEFLKDERERNGTQVSGSLYEEAADALETLSETAPNIDAAVQRAMKHDDLWKGLQHFRNGNWSEETLVRLILQVSQEVK